MSDTFDKLGGSSATLARFIRNAIIADAIGVVDLKDLPPEVDSLVSLAVDKWDEADDAALDGMVVLILLMISMTAMSEMRSSPDLADPNNHFPKY
ncbi:hypothetical protein [Nonomuraea roseola]|uniref:Carrier domain-containing protein n=1 Tax=Nonomuraea roseola TaxID=46179 RepID=A0ABV5Q1A2_9ACTN